MKAYKGFNKGMTCRGFQFEEGKTYEEEKAKLCECGFHACENPQDCYSYRAPGDSVYHEVELDDNGERNKDDSKVVGKKIKIGARLSVAEICKLHFNYVKERTTTEYTDPKLAAAGDRGSAAAGDRGSAAAGNCGSAAAGDRGSAAAGDYGSAAAGDRGSAAAGYRGSAAAGNCGSAAAGDRGSAAAGDCGSAAAGDYGSAAAGYRGSAAAGDYGSAAAGYRGSAAAGDYGSAAAGDCGSAAAGDYGSAAAGDCGSAAAGDCGSAASKGKASVGKEGVAAVRGNNCRVRGDIGSVILVAEEEKSSYKLQTYKVAVVDGKIIKANTWYTLRDGEFVEVPDDES